MNGQMISQLLNATLDGCAAGRRTTEQTITQQLNDGIRSFDFRVAVFNNNIIINHSMAGPLLTDIVSQITNGWPQAPARYCDYHSPIHSISTMVTALNSVIF